MQLTFFSAKNIRILYIESAKTVNEMTLNELVKLTTALNNWAMVASVHYLLHVCISLAWARRLCKEQLKGRKEETDTRNDGKDRS